jgi:hypothetical protein
MVSLSNCVVVKCPICLKEVEYKGPPLPGSWYCSGYKCGFRGYLDGKRIISLP